MRWSKRAITIVEQETCRIVDFEVGSTIYYLVHRGIRSMWHLCAFYAKSSD